MLRVEARCAEEEALARAESGAAPSRYVDEQRAVSASLYVDDMRATCLRLY